MDLGLDTETIILICNMKEFCNICVKYPFLENLTVLFIDN